MGIQESFRWIMRSIVLVCGLALFSVVGWQASKWWSHKRNLGEVERIICVAEDKNRLSQACWEDFFAFWLLPGQRLHPYEIQALEKQLRDSGYFKKLDIKLDSGVLRLNYEMSLPLAQVGEERLCLYPNGKVQPSLSPLDVGLIELVGIEAWNTSWPLDYAQDMVDFLSCLQNHPLFMGIKVDAKDWRGVNDPSSELVIFFQEAGAGSWMRVGSIHCIKRELLVSKLEQAYEMMSQRKACSVDLRLESALIFGYEEIPR